MHRLSAILLAVVLIAAACSDDDPEATRAELLAEIEGRQLSEAELEERGQVADALCKMDEALLIELWSQLDSDQLAFQDFVFTQECPERNQLYAENTGRFASDG